MELTLDDSYKLRSIFNSFDKNSTGHIDIIDFKKLVNEHININTNYSQEIDDIVDSIIKENTLEITYQQFTDAINVILQVKSNIPVITKAHSPNSGELYEGAGDREPIHSFQRIASVRRSRKTKVKIYNDDAIASSGDSIGDPFARSSPRQHSNHSLGSRKLLATSQADSVLAGSEDISQNSICSDDIFDDIDGNFNDLNSKVLSLQSQIEILTKDQNRADDRNTRQRDENIQLHERIHILEEQLRDVENLSKEKTNIENRNRRDTLKKLTIDHESEVDILSQKLCKLEKKYEKSESKSIRLTNRNNDLKMQLEQSVADIKYCEINITQLRQENKECKSDETKNNYEFRQKNQMVNELLAEIENRRMSDDIDVLSNKSTMDFDMSDSQRHFDESMSAMKQEIIELRNERDELKLNRLEIIDNNKMTLADEICNLSKDDLICQLNEYKIVNSRLREHLDWMTLRIIDLCPAILERV